MEIEEPVIQGLLLFPPQGVLSQLKKTWHKRYCQLFRASKYGIERLEIFDSREDFLGQQSSPRIITLENCVKIGPSNQPRVFAVVTKTGAHHFGCFTELDTKNWIAAFQQVAFPDQTPPSNQTIEEDNDLYCTSGEGVFSVKLVETEASKRCRLEEKNYTLLVADVDMKLVDGETVLFTWPYRYIRKYGYRDGKFTFEAGRKCESGEGSFRLEHSNQQEIFRCISSKMKSMKKLLRGDISTGVDLNDAQYHAALSMEAGSRSPLPPTQNSVNLIDVDFSMSSQSSQKPLIFSSSSNFSLDSLPFIRPPPPIIKPKPSKPPRKCVLPNLKDARDSEFPELGFGRYRKLTSYTSPESSKKLGKLRVDDERHPYDLVEVRNNAWKTHGIDNIPHTEKKERLPLQLPDKKGENNENDNDCDNNDKYVKINEDCDEGVSVDDSGENVDDYADCQYETMISQNAGLPATETVTASPIIHNNLTIKSDSTANYDKLQHFGSLHKLNNNPGYKAPNLSLLRSTSGNSSVADDKNHSWNDYDVVEDMKTVRMADDSSRGYGVIRKKVNAATNVTSGPQHRVFNNSEYAIVSKPKRV